MKILFLTPYPRGTAPSQRFRFELFYSLLEEQGLYYETKSFWDKKGWELLYQKGRTLAKLWSLIKAFGRRKWLMLHLQEYDIIFIHREVAPLGPPVFEWYITRVLKKRVIYDFDDAIWLPNTSEQNSIAGRLKWHGKVRSICRWSWKVSVGNDHLADFARQYSHNVEIMPTIVNTEVHRPLVKDHRQSTSDDRPTIGWTGSHSTLKYLNPLIPILQQLQEEVDFTFIVIADKDPELLLGNYQFVKWSKESEVEDLNRMDIGIMPLEDDQWSRGKCGFKAIQYGAVGIPALVSPVGVNTEIVEHGVTGYHCANEDDWMNSLKKLLQVEKLRKEMGAAGRKRTFDHYSLASQKSDFMELFE